jgi:hypothetical protein
VSDAPICPLCEGSGARLHPSRDPTIVISRSCSACKGSGRLPVDTFPAETWVAWGKQETTRLAADPDVEALLRSVGVGWSWSLWWGHPDGQLRFVGSHEGVQVTIKKERV